MSRGSYPECVRAEICSHDEPPRRRLLAHTPPLISSCLYKALPLLAFTDDLLSLVTWTNCQLYYNCAVVVTYVLVVFYWSLILVYFLPVASAILFACFYWYAHRVVQTQCDEPPTFEDVLVLLANIGSRFDLLVKPIRGKVHQPFRLCLNISLCTPVYVLIVRLLLSPRLVIMWVGVIALTYHSPWCVVLRKMLWRSMYVRIVASLVFNVGLPLDRRTADLDYKVISVSAAGKLIQFEILEHQRRWLGIGWTHILLPSDPRTFTNIGFEQTTCPDLFRFPRGREGRWRWLQPAWHLDCSFNDYAGREGWCYFNTNWNNRHCYDSVWMFTRSRKWVRRAILEYR